MTDEEMYLIHNLLSVASGQTRGRFSMGGHYARVLLRMYEAPVLHVQFSASEAFKRSLDKFLKSKDLIPFCTTLMQLIVRSAEDEFGLDAGRKMALGMFALLNKNVREECGCHE